MKERDNSIAAGLVVVGMLLFLCTLAMAWAGPSL
jgi:hypothetical protein